MNWMDRCRDEDVHMDSGMDVGMSGWMDGLTYCYKVDGWMDRCTLDSRV